MQICLISCDLESSSYFKALIHTNPDKTNLRI
uniref:Uncharacterized protein n=1 Tax=Anguilla anguilla TaxID=7936 RepID=A0A0E9PWD6_ANGAN